MNENCKDFTRLIVKFLAFSAIAICSMVGSLFAHESNNVILNTIVEWQSPPGAENLSATPYTPLCTHKGSTYFVWMDATERPFVTKITAGTPTTVPLDPNPDYKVQADGHHRFSLGVDKNGYIHIAGDMHNYNALTTGVITPYPARYQKQGMLYWKSNQPQDVSSGFSFAGTKDSSTTMPGSGWLIGHFFTDNRGELYYTSQMHAIEAGNYPGVMGLGVYRYDADNFTWTALGALPDSTRPGDYYKCLYWENSGYAPGKWFQGFEATFKFDPQNRMHFTVVSNTDVKYPGSNRILYAVSDDAGLTWAKANGKMIPGLPLRGADGAKNLADVVANAPESGPFFNFEAGLAVDKNGTPAVFVEGVTRMWDGTKWSLEGSQNYKPYVSPAYGYLNPDEDAVLAISSMNKIIRTKSFEDVSYGYDYSLTSPTPTNFVCIDEEGLKTTGIIRGIELDKKTKVQRIIKTTITPAPLPEGWENRDISATSFPYASTAGFHNGAFVVTDYGAAVGGNSDSFHFVYKTMTGDGSITARVTAGLPSPEGYCRSGVMMRAHLSHDSQLAAVLIAPGTKNRGATFVARETATSNAWDTSILAGTMPVSYWVKLVRSGNTFTGYVSADGNSWTKVNQSTIAMPNTLYVGLSPVSYANKWFMQSSTYDNVTVSP